jgi:hypothetical protein
VGLVGKLVETLTGYEDIFLLIQHFRNKKIFFRTDIDIDIDIDIIIIIIIIIISVNVWIRSVPMLNNDPSNFWYPVDPFPLFVKVKLSLCLTS